MIYTFGLLYFLTVCYIQKNVHEFDEDESWEETLEFFRELNRKYNE